MGSCRLYEPFLAACDEFKLKMIYGQSTPFTYSAGESWQYLNFCRGRIDIPRWQWPYVFSDDRIQEPCPELTEAIDKAGVFLVEISTLDQLTCSGRFFNWNEVGLKFVRGRGEAYFRWWRELTNRETRRASPESVSKILRTRAETGLENPPELAEFLTDLRFETLDATSLRAHLIRLTADVTGEWIFVSHFNTASEGPEVLEDRGALLSVLTEAAKPLGHRVFDPTATVEAFGYRRALKGHGADKHHYEDHFKSTMGRTYVRCICGPNPSCEPNAVSPPSVSSNQATTSDSTAPTRLDLETSMGNQEWGRALAIAARLRETLPTEPAGWVLAAQVLGRTERQGDAERLLVDAVGNFPESAWAAHAWANSASEAGAWSEAQERWRAVRERFPGDFAGYTNGAAAFMQAGAFSEAESLLAQALDHFPQQPDPWVRLGELKGFQGLWSEATECWSDVRRLFPNLSVGYGSGAEALGALRRLQDADDLASEGMRRFPDDRWIHHVHAGLAVRRNDWAMAAERWGAVRQRFPSDPVAFEVGIQCLRELHKTTEANELSREAIRRFPDHRVINSLFAESLRHRAE